MPLVEDNRLSMQEAIVWVMWLGMMVTVVVQRMMFVASLEMDTDCVT